MSIGRFFKLISPSKWNALFILGLFFASNNISAAPLVYLTKSITAETAIETTTQPFVMDYTTTNSLDDSVDRNVPLGFSFPFSNATYTQVNIVSNGYLRFTTINNTYYTNQTLSSIDASMPTAILPYWDDMNPANGGTITYDQFGTAPNRYFAVTWKNVPHYPNSGSYTFQVVLHEDGAIRFRYDSTSSTNGSSATIGVIEANTIFDQHSYNATINPSQDIFYYRPANLSIKKQSCIINDPVNLTVNPKRIPGATIRYAVEVSNTGVGRASNALINDTVPATFDTATIRNLQIQSGACNCLGVASASANPAPGTGNGVHPIVLNFSTIPAGSVATPSKKCGYFEVDIQ